MLRVTESCVISKQTLFSPEDSVMTFMMGVSFCAIHLTVSAYYKILVLVDLVLVEEVEEKILIVKESSYN